MSRDLLYVTLTAAWLLMLIGVIGALNYHTRLSKAILFHIGGQTYLRRGEGDPEGTTPQSTHHEKNTSQTSCWTKTNTTA